MKATLLSLLMIVLPCLPSGAQIKVAALHPMMADLAREIGGERVIVADLMSKGVNPHQFEPRPADLKALAGSRLVLAAGKGMESYLDRVRVVVGQRGTVVEVGRTIPSLRIGKDAVYTCCAQHAVGAIDPHWWHGVDNMKRASLVVAKALSAVDPAGKKTYEKAAADYGRRMRALKKWVKLEVTKIPKKQRKLVSAHTAFAYFGKEFGFDVISVAGLNREQATQPQELARTMDTIRKEKVRAVFPEHGVSNKSIESIARQTGVRIGKPLNSDGMSYGGSRGFEGMVRYNVRSIVEALAPE